MECSCAIDISEMDFEPVELLNIEERIARKPHMCRECHREIERGEKYQYVSYKYDGDFNEEKMCSDCLSAKKQFFPHGGHIWLWDDIANEVVEMDGEVPETCISKLTPRAQAMLCDIIEKHFSEE